MAGHVTTTDLNIDFTKYVNTGNRSRFLFLCKSFPCNPLLEGCSKMYKWTKSRIVDCSMAQLNPDNVSANSFQVVLTGPSFITWNLDFPSSDLTLSKSEFQVGSKRDNLKVAIQYGCHFNSVG